MNLLTVLRLIATLIYAALIGYCLHCLTLAVRHFTLHVRASRRWVMCRHQTDLRKPLFFKYGVSKSFLLWGLGNGVLLPIDNFLQ